MLRLTKVEIELLTDIDQILFIEKNIRGGVSYINQRYCKEDENTSLHYIDGKITSFSYECICYINFLYSK